MMNEIDPLVQLALGFLSIAAAGLLLTVIGWGMSRSANQREAAPALNDIQVGNAQRSDTH